MGVTVGGVVGVGDGTGVGTGVVTTGGGVGLLTTGGGVGVFVPGVGVGVIGSGLFTGGSLGVGVGVAGSGVRVGSGVGCVAWPSDGVAGDESKFVLDPPPQAENKIHTNTKLVNFADNDTFVTSLELVL